MPNPCSDCLKKKIGCLCPAVFEATVEARFSNEPQGKILPEQTKIPDPLRARIRNFFSQKKAEK
jgi:hypothetical protein